MDYNYIKDSIGKMVDENYEDFVKAIISIEKNIDDSKVLDKIYSEFMENDEIQLINNGFDEIIEKIKNK